MNTSAIRNAWTLIRNRRRISGNDSRNTSMLKKDRLTSGHPGELTTTRITAVKNTTVLTKAMTTPRRPSTPPPRIRERLSPGSGIGCGADPGGVPRSELTRGLLEDRGVGLVRQPLLLDRGERPVGLQLVEDLVDALDQRVPLREDHPEVLLRSDGWELTHDGAVLDLH